MSITAMNGGGMALASAGMQLATSAMDVMSSGLQLAAQLKQNLGNAQSQLPYGGNGTQSASQMPSGAPAMATPALGGPAQGGPAGAMNGIAGILQSLMQLLQILTQMQGMGQGGGMGAPGMGGGMNAPALGVANQFPQAAAMPLAAPQIGMPQAGMPMQQGYAMTPDTGMAGMPSAQQQSYNWAMGYANAFTSQSDMKNLMQLHMIFNTGRNHL
ncbi:hypothetical protein OOT46_20825 [Aquabacterium sp. A7-Y]|uniref:hypothetical protein n=1 Tax=Aquabacterium sp. A7-Y TaxID=1349605 RepID=UPI00223D50DF|nr:hypothetical protein [Aquabacterium sp. A7-Y]MCW7540282.1 hypothetical protein [Aquabacterium sp. A7-Y]